MIFGAVVLRDIPKEEVQIDLNSYTIHGGFRGFTMVPPGLHYVKVKSGKNYFGFWHFLKPSEVIVKVFDSGTNTFVDDTPESIENFKSLALGGNMGTALYQYQHESFGPWFGLVQSISENNFPPILYPIETGNGKRYEMAFKNTHKGNIESFLSEFQYAFAMWLLHSGSESENGKAYERWKHLLLSCYNAGEDAITESPSLFSKLADTLIRQFDTLSEEWFKPGSFLHSQVSYMIEDMKDSGEKALEAKAHTLSRYMKKRMT